MSKDKKKEFAKNLKLARKSRKYSQDDMAEKLEITKEEYTGYEIGFRQPDVKRLELIAEVLEVSVEDLLGEDIKAYSELLAEARVKYGIEEMVSLEEYFAMPNCMDYELIHGKLVHRNTPSYEHQRIVLRFSMALDQYLSTYCSKCTVVPAPFGVVLDEKVPTVVQPDISVVCNPQFIQEGMCYGPPDIIVEILSPSNEDYDLLEKRELYQFYGVGEYWIVNPRKKRVILYDFETGNSPVVGSFDMYIASARIKGFRLCMSEIMK